MDTLRITTMTISSHTNVQINLANVGKYLDIDDDIVGIKYNHANDSIMKGTYSTTLYKKTKGKDLSKINKNLFYNQITIVFNNGGNHVNVKLFGNGSLHMTGCKSSGEGEQVTRKVMDKLRVLKNIKSTLFLSKDPNGVLIDKDKLVYSYTTKQVIGYIKNTGNIQTVYCIAKKDYVIDKKTRMFISNKSFQRKREMCNFDGVPIGFLQIQMLKNKNKFYRKNNNIYIDDDVGLIYYNNEDIIGKLVYEIDDTKVTNFDSLDDTYEIQYDCDPFTERSDPELSDSVVVNEQFETNINCINVCFNVGFEINRQKMYECLIDYGFICKYRPDSYSGIKLLYKHSIELNKVFGRCTCTNKCTCNNVSFLIFQSGNIIGSGFKSESQINPIIKHFLQMCQEIKSKCVKKSNLHTGKVYDQNEPQQSALEQVERAIVLN